jgi:hypothetical protein
VEHPRPINLASNAPDNRPIRQTVYLDLWVWIQLARVHFGKPQSGAWREAHDAVKSSALEGTGRFPVSFAHMKEIAKRKNDASRGRLVDFMTDVWNADAIRPWSQMLEPEARNAVRFMMGMPRIDLTDFVFGKGLSHALGGNPRLVPKHPNARPPPPETIREISELVMSPTLLASLKDPGLAAKMGSRSESETRYLSDLQARIDAAYAHPDKTKKRDIAKARFMITVVGDSLIRAMLEASPDPRALLAEYTSSRDRIEATLEAMPTFKTFRELTYSSETTRRAKESDLWDMALNIAIPYCDIVATERSWCNIAKGAGLDKLYGTSLVHQPAELAALLKT